MKSIRFGGSRSKVKVPQSWKFIRRPGRGNILDHLGSGRLLVYFIFNFSTTIYASVALPVALCKYIYDYDMIMSIVLFSGKAMENRTTNEILTKLVLCTFALFILQVYVISFYLVNRVQFLYKLATLIYKYRTLPITALQLIDVILARSVDVDKLDVVRMNTTFNGRIFIAASQQARLFL